LKHYSNPILKVCYAKKQCYGVRKAKFFFVLL